MLDDARRRYGYDVDEEFYRWLYDVPRLVDPVRLAIGLDRAG